MLYICKNQEEIIFLFCMYFRYIKDVYFNDLWVHVSPRVLLKSPRMIFIIVYSIFDDVLIYTNNINIHSF